MKSILYLLLTLWIILILPFNANGAEEIAKNTLKKKETLNKSTQNDHTLTPPIQNGIFTRSMVSETLFSQKTSASTNSSSASLRWHIFN